MKTGKTLNELAAELTRIQECKRDVIVPTSLLKMNDNAEIEFESNGKTSAFKINNHSFGQVATHADIPKAYADRLRAESPALLAKNVNHGFNQIVKTRETGKKPDARLLRTIDGNMRGFLSSSYRMLDAHDVLETILPHLINNKFEIVSSEITEKRLYLKTSSPKIQGEIVKGDVVQFGVMVSTSDVGAGMLKIEPYANRLVCTNGMVSATTFKKAHLGRNQFENDIMEILTDDTKKLNDAAFFATMRDYLTNAMKPEVFEREINKMKQAAGIKIENFGDLEKVIELSMNAVGIRGEKMKSSLLSALATGNEGAGLTMWGLANSYTAVAKNDEIDYDTATDLERAGGAILELSPTQWKSIAC